MFEINCDFAKGIGAEKLVLHLWGVMASDGHENVDVGLLNRQFAYIREKMNVFEH